jgi:hypothetical protein
MIKGNTGESRASSKRHSMEQYSVLTVEFAGTYKQMDNGEGFTLKYKANGGDWKLARKFKKGTDWSDNWFWRTASVEIDASNFNNIKLGFKANLNTGTDNMFFDKVILLCT